MWRSEVLDLLRSGDDASLDRAFSVKEQHIPDCVYKYRAPTAQSLADLRDGLAWFSEARSFNDPFDSSIALNAEPILRARMVEELSNGRIEKVSRDEQTRLAQTALPLAELMAELFSLDPQGSTDVNPKVVREYEEIIANQSSEIAADLEPRFKDVKVCSFTTDGRSLPMWSHYAKDHTGYCVEYPLKDLGAEDPRRKWIFPVQYDDQRFDLSPWLRGPKSTGSTKHFRMLPLLATLHKALAWAYECEWRMVNISEVKAPGILIQMPTPSAIYLGCRMKQRPRKELREIARAKRVPLFKMRMSDVGYAIAPYPA